MKLDPYLKLNKNRIQIDKRVNINTSPVSYPCKNKNIKFLIFILAMTFLATIPETQANKANKGKWDHPTRLLHSKGRKLKRQSTGKHW